jgi:hypothetical protein
MEPAKAKSSLMLDHMVQSDTTLGIGYVGCECQRKLNCLFGGKVA